jgi:hypothetical protein
LVRVIASVLVQINRIKPQNTRVSSFRQILTLCRLNESVTKSQIA